MRQLSVDPGPGGILLRRAGNFAFARPTREVLFTIVPREDKYKAKSFIDTVIYRTGDQVGAWSFATLGFLGLAMTGISIVAVPVSIGWLLKALWPGQSRSGLRGRRHQVHHFPPREKHRFAQTPMTRSRGINYNAKESYYEAAQLF